MHITADQLQMVLDTSGLFFVCVCVLFCISVCLPDSIIHNFQCKYSFGFFSFPTRHHHVKFMSHSANLSK